MGAGVAGVVIAVTTWFAPSGAALAQTPDPVATCAVAGRPCFSAAELQQLAKVGDDVMARRVPADTPPAVAASIRQFVDFWVAYSAALGHTIALGFLPG